MPNRQGGAPRRVKELKLLGLFDLESPISIFQSTPEKKNGKIQRLKLVFMCLIDKVAHRGGSSGYARFPPAGDAGGADEQQEYYSQSSRNRQVNQAMMQQRNQGVMFLGSQSQASEMSTMVSALAHVASGQRAGDWGYGGNVAGEVSSGFGLSGPSADSPSASGLWIGQKRGREDETSAQLVESAAPRVQRSFQLILCYHLLL